MSLPRPTKTNLHPLPDTSFGISPGALIKFGSALPIELTTRTSGGNSATLARLLVKGDQSMKPCSANRLPPTLEQPQRSTTVAIWAFLAAPRRNRSQSTALRGRSGDRIEDPVRTALIAVQVAATDKAELLGRARRSGVSGLHPGHDQLIGHARG